MALWGGRFEKDMDQIVKEFNASIGFDQRMYNEDIDGSIAHVTMLAEQGIVTEEESRQIIDGLERIREKIRSGEITFNVEDEDIHMGIESRLIALIGETGKKLHTARSRNDQCQVDGRLYLKERFRDILANCWCPGGHDPAQGRSVCGGDYCRLYSYPARSAHHHRIRVHGVFPDVPPGYRTPEGYLDRMDYLPAGSLRLAGTTLPINRDRTAELWDSRHRPRMPWMPSATVTTAWNSSVMPASP